MNALATDDPTSYRPVLRLALPAIGYSILQTLIFIADRAMIGRFSSTGLASMQIASVIEWSLGSIFMALEVGVLARIGFLYGAREFPRVRSLAKNALAIAMTLGVFVAIGTPLVRASLGGFGGGSPESVIRGAADYLLFTIAASPFVYVGIASAAIFQGINDTRTPLIVGVLANILHVPLNVVFIFGGLGVPAMGIKGCGISSALTFALEAILLAIALGLRLRALGRDSADRKVALSDARDAFRIAIPSFAERVVFHAGYLTFISIINRLGEESMAANQVLISIEAICFLGADGFAVAAASLVAQRKGAKDLGGAVRSAKTALVLGTSALFVAGVVSLVGRDLFIPFFSPDPKVQALARSIIVLFLVAEPLLAYASIVGQSLRGAGHTFDALITTILSAVVIRVSLTWFFGIHLGLGLFGVWIGSTVDWGMRSVMLFLFARYRIKEAFRAEAASVRG